MELARQPCFAVTKRDNKDMRKIGVLIIAAVMLSTYIPASAAWDLDSCINYAVSHNITVLSRTLDVTSSELDITEAQNRFLPAVSAQGQQSFNFGRGLTSNNTYANRNTQSTSFGIGLEVPVFQGLAGIRRLDYARCGLRGALERLEAARDNVELNVMAQYLQVLYCGEIADISRETLRMSEYELERRRALVDGGKLPELDLYEAEAQVARDRLTVTTSENDRALALLDLAQMLRLPSADGFEITPLPVEEQPVERFETVYDYALEHNHGVLASLRDIETAGSNIRLAQTGWIPTLSLNAGISANYYKVNGMDNPSFRSQMRDNFSKYIGLSLSVPIFDRFNTRNSVRRARVQKLNAELQYEQTTSDLYKSIEQASYLAKAAEDKLAAAKIAEASGLKALEGMRDKYEYGKATAAEYEQARSTWLRAVLERTQASYELQLRRRILRFYSR